MNKISIFSHVVHGNNNDVKTTYVMKTKIKVLVSIFVSSLFFFSSCQPIHTRGIDFVEIGIEEYNQASKNKVNQLNRCDEKVLIMQSFMNEFADSIKEVFGEPFHWESTDMFGNKLVNVEKVMIDDDSLYIVNVYYPIKDRAYVYRTDGKRISEGIFGYGLVDENLYVSHEGFDCDEYVWYRFYQLNKDTVKQCAEIKSSYDYYTPIMDNSYFFGEDHFFYFMVMKKGEESLRYYKADVSKLIGK